MKREWRYPALAVDGRRGTLRWCRIASRQGAAIAEAVVWDGASGHRGPAVRPVGVTLVPQPPAAPDLQPAERVVEERRRVMELVA